MTLHYNISNIESIFLKKISFKTKFLYLMNNSFYTVPEYVEHNIKN
jgi:hypothetical protein